MCSDADHHPWYVKCPRSLLHVFEGLVAWGLVVVKMHPASVCPDVVNRRACGEMRVMGGLEC